MRMLLISLNAPLMEIKLLHIIMEISLKTETFHFTLDMIRVYLAISMETMAQQSVGLIKSLSTLDPDLRKLPCQCQ